MSKTMRSKRNRRSKEVIDSIITKLQGVNRHFRRCAKDKDKATN